MIGGDRYLDRVTMTLRSQQGDMLNIYIDVADNSLSRKWLSALNQVLANDLHLEKNYCWIGFADGDRTAQYILDQINHSIRMINAADLDYHINDYFNLENSIVPGEMGPGLPGGDVNHVHFNRLHRYFEDLQGVSGRMSQHYLKANARTRWHIRQLNLLCHEFESLALSLRKKIVAPEWQRPSQLMCWLNSPRFVLDPSDYELFGIETINRPLGGVFVGVNKAVGKHHWEVFQDEGRDSRINELVTSSLRSQTEAAGDFDIEWANDPGNFEFQKKKLSEFRAWLIDNGFDPNDPTLTIGHPQVAQVDLDASFGTRDYRVIWSQLNHYLDVYKISTAEHSAVYDYRWNDSDYADRQIKILAGEQ